MSALFSFSLLPPPPPTFSITSLSTPSPTSPACQSGSFSMPPKPSSPSSEEESQKKIAVSQLQQLPRRKRATPQQRAVLLHVFKKTRFPDTNCRLRLAKELGMTPRSVQVWFQNQRQRTLTRDSPPSFHNSSLGAAADDSPLSSSPSPSRSPSPVPSPSSAPSALPSLPNLFSATQSPSSSPCVPIKPIPSYGAYPSPLISEPSSPDQLSPLTHKPLFPNPPEGLPFLTLPPLVMNPEYVQRQQAFPFPNPFASLPPLPQVRDLDFLSSVALKRC